VDEPRTHYQLSFTSRQALLLFVGLLAALGVAYTLGVLTGLAGARRGGEPPREESGAAAARVAASAPTPERTAAIEAAPATPGADLEVPMPVRGVSPRFVGTPVGKTGSVTRIAEPPPGPASSSSAQPEPTPSPGLQLFEDEGGPPARPTHPPSAAPRRPTATPAHAHAPAHSAVAAPAAAATTSSAFWVQALSASSSTEAKTRRDRLAARGYPATVVAGEAPNGTHVYRVRVGPYKTREDADRAAGKLQANEKLHPWVVPPGK
jgi:cell division protein FtsN